MGSAPMDSLLPGTPAFLGKLRRFWASVKIRRRERSLRLCETLSLGEKRLVAVLEFERQRYLIGVTNQSIVLLQGLGETGRPAVGARELSGERR